MTPGMVQPGFVRHGRQTSRDESRQVQARREGGVHCVRPLRLSLDVHGTDFQQRVWAALREIPYGETRSYSEIARVIGKPNAVRAVARACAANPVALVVPCHRVVRADGELSGYRRGVGRKRALLEQEQTFASRTVRLRELLSLSIGFPTPAKIDQVYQRYQNERCWKLLVHESGGEVVG